AAGGGGGWYGGGAKIAGGGGGGSSYISGYYENADSWENAAENSRCALSETGYVFERATMIAGNATMPSPTGGSETGHSGTCYAYINLVEID
ncbi:MAG: hypothetical protein LUC98_04940, partial [Lachnospiraceae bacterium]|nr:hypothetical protein [Lachnospiraceae bacterium]